MGHYKYCSKNKGNPRKRDKGEKKERNMGNNMDP